jgi:hypothetical protein
VVVVLVAVVVLTEAVVTGAGTVAVFFRNSLFAMT